MAKVKVLIVDDSAVVRSFLQAVIKSDPDLELVGWAPDPFVARDKLIELSPDVMVLDVEMPRMDGITFLSKVMDHKPTRTVIFSSLTVGNSPMVMRAYEAGAIDVIAKPDIDVTSGLAELGNELIIRIKAAASAKFVSRKQSNHRPKIETKALSKTTHKLIAIASSTGGTEALKEILPFFPPDISGMVIVQHMPALFTKTFAEALSKLCPFEVREAEDGDKIIPGRALLAPGNFHVEVVRQGGYYHVKLNQNPTLHGVRPAADHLFKSVASQVGSNAVGAILTGMGKDGAEGLRDMRNAGAWTIGQDESSCVVYGMPKAAAELGAICETLPLDQIAYGIYRRAQ